MNDILLSNIYDKMKKLLIFMLIATALSGATTSAQTEVPDSIAQKVNMSDSLGNSGAASPAGALGGELLTDSISLQNYSPAYPLPSPYLGSIPGTLQAYRLSVPTDGRIFLWKNGGIFGSVSNASLPGLMGIEQGALNFVQQLDASRSAPMPTPSSMAITADCKPRSATAARYPISSVTA